MSTPATTRKPTTTKSTTRRWGLVPINVSIISFEMFLIYSLGSRAVDGKRFLESNASLIVGALT